MSRYIKDKVSYFRQHWFVRIGHSQVGNFSNTFIRGLTGIIIARLLQPELFGVYAISLVWRPFGLSGEFRYQDTGATLLAGRTPAKITKAQRGLFFWVNGFVIAILSVIAILIAPSLAEKVYHNPLIGWYAGILVMASFISNTFLNFSVLTYQVMGKIKQMTLLTFTDQTLRNILAVLLVAGGLGITGAMSGHLLGAVAMLTVSVIVWERLRKSHSIFPSVWEFFKNSRIKENILVLALGWL